MMCAARLEERQETTFDFLLTTNRLRIKIEAFVARFERQEKRFSASISGNKRALLGRRRKSRIHLMSPIQDLSYNLLQI